MARNWKSKTIRAAKDILTAFVVVAVIMLALYAYFGIWPPLVVVESGSMMHSEDRSYIGVIDTGDMVFVKKIGGREDLVTYVEGEMTGYSTYGEYGDVVVYRPNGLSTNAQGQEIIPIIHRLVVWLEINDTAVDPGHAGVDYANYSFDVPELGLRGSTDDITIQDYGYEHETVTIRLGRQAGGLLQYYESRGIVPHSGYITMGDHNAPSYDQPMIGSEPVLPKWIIGKARGELPWFGLIKLKLTGSAGGAIPANSWRNLIITVALLLAVPVFLDYGLPPIRERLKRPRDGEELASRTDALADTGKDGPPGETATPPEAEPPEDTLRPGKAEWPRGNTEETGMTDENEAPNEGHDESPPPAPEQAGPP